jgi:hypothetical protein
MGYEIYENGDGRDCGYGVPAICDHPECKKEINRGSDYKCDKCGLFFCEEHLFYADQSDLSREEFSCESCFEGEPPFTPKPDKLEWIEHKLTHESWREWREENVDHVKSLNDLISKRKEEEKR